MTDFSLGEFVGEDGKELLGLEVGRVGKRDSTAFRDDCFSSVGANETFETGRLKRKKSSELERALLIEVADERENERDGN